MILPTAADEARFWTMLENAWSGLGPELNELRRAMSDPDVTFDGYDEIAALEEGFDHVLAALRAAAADLSSEELTALDRVVERKLHDIDRQDVHEATDGSDDGFLYARGFVLALGREFYEAVSRDPSVAVEDASAESFCYLFARVHEEKFGGYPETGSGISRESFSNPAGWRD
ncbi:DUF4240 domain-containing protein [Saccharothrix sp. Mg75]|uniref:DUF4240 domain-containing protein n=1 Tax=Saccharothrix sp. Mg75 TaxID=3445357 RepID=UPI003EE91673